MSTRELLTPAAARMQAQALALRLKADVLGLQLSNLSLEMADLFLEGDDSPRCVDDALRGALREAADLMVELALTCGLPHRCGSEATRGLRELTYSLAQFVESVFDALNAALKDAMPSAEHDDSSTSRGAATPSDITVGASECRCADSRTGTQDGGAR